MVKIRLARFGSKHNPHYRIVVTDARRKRDGKYIEKSGPGTGSPWAPSPRTPPAGSSARRGSSGRRPGRAPEGKAGRGPGKSPGPFV